MPAALTPDALVHDLRAAVDPRVSPDGARIVYALASTPRGGPATTQLHLCDVEGGGSRPLTHAGTANGSARWSPDGTRLAFVSDRGGEPALLLLRLDGGDPVEVARHPKAPAEPAWSPDGTRIAYTVEVDPGPPTEGAGVAPAVRVVRTRDHQTDTRGFLGERRAQVHVVDLASHEARCLTTAPVDHTFPSWSPDGRTIAVRVSGNAVESRLGLVDARTGETTLVGDVTGGVGCWAWHPDGDRLFLAQDDGSGHTLSLAVHDRRTAVTTVLDGDPPFLAAAGFPPLLGPAQPVWLDDRRVLVAGSRHGRGGLWVVDVVTGTSAPLAHGEAQQVGLSCDAAGTVAVQGWGSWDTVGEVAVTDLASGRSRRVTHLNDDVLAARPRPDVERLGLERDGLTIEGWLLLPHRSDGEPVPLVLDVHGGPHAFYGPGFLGWQQALVGAGFAVLATNPRGSTSYGRDFASRVTGDWGGADMGDLLALLEVAASRPEVDAGRLGVYGGSYGGYAASWLIGHGDRFSAAVILAPVTDLVSMYGTSDIGFWLAREMGARPQDDPSRYRERSSLTHIGAARTPALLLHGEDDLRCPLGQGEQLYAALRDAGCETELVRYPGASHLFLRVGAPEHRVDALERVVGWFEAHLGGTGEDGASPG
jgi:dipeptidyl aminopeptidase/acylaminoacyl peptidase